MEPVTLGIISIDMTVGMLLGMAASPIMMKGIKEFRKRRKINRMLHEIADIRRGGS
ncbi:MAG: hypothetical protein MN733_23080 [Nitrososphaera sp.]|nr:hypothetical protein [Nitrososphaera sp.]